MVHQASKIDDKDEKERYLKWLEDLEYKKMGIPEPDLVIFLNMPPETARNLMESRRNKITGREEKDIHEKDTAYLETSHKNACEIAKKYRWREVRCVGEKGLKSIDEISREVYKLVEGVI